MAILGLASLFAVFFSVPTTLSNESGCPKCGSENIVKNGMTGYGKVRGRI